MTNPHRRADDHPAPPAMEGRGIWPFLGKATATLAGVIGLATLALGIWLMSLGGTAYYLCAGLGLAAACVLAWRMRPGAALLAMGAVVAGTLVWSLWELNAKGWMPAWPVDLAARVGVLLGLFALMLFAWGMARPRATAVQRRRSRRASLVGALATAAVTAGLVALGWERPQPPAAASAPGTAPAATPGAADTDWLAFGNTPRGERHVAAAQITPANVHQLREAWRFHSGDLSPDPERVFYSAQNTPIKAGDLLYMCTPRNRVFALDAGTGQERWRFVPEVNERTMESAFSAACRAVGYHADPAAPQGAACASRVYVATAQGALHALDALTGSVCTGFGRNGAVDLTEGMALTEAGHASNTSGPAVVGDLLVVGQQVSDNQRRDAPSGVVRAYDARTGALRWAWDAKRTDRTTEPLAPGETWPQGTPNVWNVISGDEELGLVLLGTGNSGNDHYGGNRDPEDDEFSSAVVALDMATGATRWHYRTVLEDRFDYDIGAQPVITDVEVGGQRRRAVVQAAKTGSLFVLDAATGEPLHPVEMKPAPQGGVEGERLSPVQPHTTYYPSLAGHPGREPERLHPRDTFGLTPIDAALCRIAFHQMRYDGIFTPPSTEGKGTLLFPGTVGGPNWGGIAVDAARGIVLTNHSRMANQVLLIPRADVSDVAVGDGGRRPDQEVAPQKGAPWGVSRPMWLSMLGVPCIAPPWGYLAATDLSSGQLLWSQPLGTGYDSGPLGIPTRLRLQLGTANLGGAVVTGSGLTFIAAAQDQWLRAFETATGRLLWTGRLPAGGQASAMSYMHRGRQYVAIGAAGHARLETKAGDALVVYALPADVAGAP